MKGYILHCKPIENTQEVNRGIFIVVSDALNSPPHVGMSFNGLYSSLTHKGHEINIRLDAFLKKMRSINCACIFIQIKPHPVLSIDYLHALFLEFLSCFKKAGYQNATCLSPIKLFFQEAFFMSSTAYNFVFELVPELKTQDLISSVYSIFFNLKKANEWHEYNFPVYGIDEIHEFIRIKSSA